MGISASPVGKGDSNLVLLEDACKGLTALQLHDTRLDVHGEILQVHGAGQCQGDSGKRRESNVAGSTDQGSCTSILVTARNQLTRRGRGVKEVRKLVFF